MDRYGDTPEGMAESALEFGRICMREGFLNVVFSMKSSNVRVMVQSTRLLVEKMMAEGMSFPVHLGVTEAGDGNDGIIKSAAGIGTLLEEGIGDTIRVSLTGAPEIEIPVALAITKRYNAARSSNQLNEHVKIVEGNALEMKNHLASTDLSDTKPLILKNSYESENLLRFQVDSAIDFGSLLIDGIGDAIWPQAQNINAETVAQTGFAILQATRARITRTEFISCPSCGRTLFDIEKTLQEVKSATQHLKGLKIAVMGCIVNGPGEMADADYGYVGAGKGSVTLYKGKDIAFKNIPEAGAIDMLINLIKQSGGWKEAAEI
jgi:(E)-4-hydroxy-3-methylbut-2-enyl-diphosphate synthase